MENKEAPPRRRVCRHYSAADRKRLIAEQSASGLTKKAFCIERGINLGTFYGWRTPSTSAQPSAEFAQVSVPTSAPAAVEVLLPNGVRVGIRHNGRREELASLVRGIAGV